MLARTILRRTTRPIVPRNARHFSPSVTIMSPEKQQEPRVIESIDVPGDGMKWVKLRKINWEDQTGRKASLKDYLQYLLSALIIKTCVWWIYYSESGKPPIGRLGRERSTVSFCFSFLPSSYPLSILLKRSSD